MEDLRTLAPSTERETVSVNFSAKQNEKIVNHSGGVSIPLNYMKAHRTLINFQEEEQLKANKVLINLNSQGLSECVRSAFVKRPRNSFSIGYVPRRKPFELQTITPRSKHD